MRLMHTLTVVSALISAPAYAAVFDITIDGSDAIFLAGRTDLTIPPASDPWPGGLARHLGPTPEEIQETFPPVISVTTGDTIKVLDPAIGGISYFNGVGAPFYGPAGNGASTASNLFAFGGISGYVGPEGALTGVFLDNSIPSSGPPATLLLADYGGSLDFSTFTPGLGQVFYIGDGSTSGGGLKEFIAPTGATRLFFGIPDGFGFDGVPGAYDDNDGSYRIRVGVNETPTPPAVPLPAGGVLLLSGLGLLAWRRKRG